MDVINLAGVIKRRPFFTRVRGPQITTVSRYSP